ACMSRLSRHARPCAGPPRLGPFTEQTKTWIAGTSLAMTVKAECGETSKHCWRRRRGIGTGIQQRQNLRHDLARLRLDRDNDRPLVGPRLLERGELAPQQARRHEMSMPHGHAAGDQLLASLEVDQANVRACADQNIT